MNALHTTSLAFAVVGSPIGHSKSPAMHRAAYRALGLPHTYEAILANGDELPAIVDRLRRGELSGINVTVPHKKRVLGLVDVIDSLPMKASSAIDIWKVFITSAENALPAPSNSATASVHT